MRTLLIFVGSAFENLWQDRYAFLHNILRSCGSSAALIDTHGISKSGGGGREWGSPTGLLMYAKTQSLK
jgi:hypothetical protein